MLVGLLSHSCMMAYGQVSETVRSSIGPSPDTIYVRLNQQLTQARQRGDLSGQADKQQQLGVLLYHQGNYASGIRYLLQAQSILRRTNQADRLAENLNQLGTVYYYNRQPRLARRQFDEAEAIYQRTTNWLGLAQTYGNIGHLYEKEGDLPTALHYQRRALAQHRSIREPASLAVIYENLGSIYEDQARYDSARFYYQAAMQLLPPTDRSGQIGLINNLGDIHRKTGRYAAAIQQYRQGVWQARRLNDKLSLIHI